MASEEVGIVRILSGDTATDPADNYLTDDQLQSLLDSSNGNTYLAAANALRSVAVNQVLLYKKVQVEGLLVDGPDLAEALLEAAKQFDDLVSDDELETGIYTDIGAF